MKNKFIIGVVLVGGIIFTLMYVGKEPQSVVVQKSEEVAVEAVAIPADMPTNVPMYPDAILDRAEDIPGTSERNVTLTLVAQATVADVNTWYRGALKENGWSVTDDKVVAGYVLLKGENQNLTTFIQTANGTEEGTVVITERIRIRNQE